MSHKGNPHNRLYNIKLYSASKKSPPMQVVFFRAMLYSLFVRPFIRAKRDSDTS